MGKWEELKDVVITESLGSVQHAPHSPQSRVFTRPTHTHNSIFFSPISKSMGVLVFQM